MDALVCDRRIPLHNIDWCSGSTYCSISSVFASSTNWLSNIALHGWDGGDSQSLNISSRNDQVAVFSLVNAVMKILLHWTILSFWGHLFASQLICKVLDRMGARHGITMSSSQPHTSTVLYAEKSKLGKCLSQIIFPAAKSCVSNAITICYSADENSSCSKTFGCCFRYK